RRRVDRIETRRVDPVARRLDRGINNSNVGVEVEYGSADERRGGGAENDRHEDDGLEGRGPADSLGEDPIDQAYERHQEREDEDPDDIVSESHEDAGRREDLFVVGESYVIAGGRMVEAVSGGGHQRIHRDGQQEYGARRQERQRAEVVSPTTTGIAGGADRRRRPATHTRPRLGVNRRHSATSSLLTLKSQSLA